jgi:hypothetical protein
MRPSTARELWTRLIALFPGFAEYHSLDDLEESERDDAATLHSIMMPFTQYFGRDLSIFTDKQLKTLANLLNDAVSIDDDLENGVSTCFLEHLRQIRGYKALAHYLSAVAKDKTHA